MIFHEDCHDEFFEDTSTTEFGFNYLVTEVEETNRTVEFTKQEFIEAVEGSQSEFGEDAVPEKYRELL